MYRPVPGGIQQVSPPTVGPVDDLVADLLARSQDVLCIGDGAERYREEITEGFRCEISRADVSVGRDARAARPRSRLARRVGASRRDRADLPAGPRRADQLDGPRGAAMSVLCVSLDAVRRRPAGCSHDRAVPGAASARGAADRAGCVPEAVVAIGVRERDFARSRRAAVTTWSPATARAVGESSGTPACGSCPILTAIRRTSPTSSLRPMQGGSVSANA